MDRTERTAVLKAQLRVLATAGLIGVPVSFAAFAFLALLHWLTGFVWEDLPERLGFGALPWWWPAPWLAVGGLLVGIAVRYLPGRGGHVPLEGLSAEPVPPSHTPGILLAALGGLPLGAVLGPEAPLIAVGSAAATALTHRWGPQRGTPEHAVLSAAGAASAIAVIFGSPLIAAVFIVESAAATGHRRAKIVLPCLLASGIGALIFTGLGSWTGFEIVSMALLEIAGPLELGLTDLLWTLPAAVAIAYAVKQLHRLGHWFGSRSIRRPAAAAILAGLVIAACAGAYSLLTSRSPVEVALSGQETLAEVAADPQAWTAGALVALLAFKGLAYGVSSRRCAGPDLPGPVPRRGGRTADVRLAGVRDDTGPGRRNGRRHDRDPAAPGLIGGAGDDPAGSGLGLDDTDRAGRGGGGVRLRAGARQHREPS
ncbi:hypothetical protein GCM10029992_08420 [Glycomyces albus]